MKSSAWWRLQKAFIFKETCRANWFHNRTTDASGPWPKFTYSSAHCPGMGCFCYRYSDPSVHTFWLRGAVVEKRSPRKACRIWEEKRKGRKTHWESSICLGVEVILIDYSTTCFRRLRMLAGWNSLFHQTDRPLYPKLLWISISLDFVST